MNAREIKCPAYCLRRMFERSPNRQISGIVEELVYIQPTSVTAAFRYDGLEVSELAYLERKD